MIEHLEVSLRVLCVMYRIFIENTSNICSEFSVELSARALASYIVTVSKYFQNTLGRRSNHALGVKDASFGESLFSPN